MVKMKQAIQAAPQERAQRKFAAPRKRTAAVFQQDWQSYRRIVRNNYLFHREAYGELRRVLVEETTGPFRFLDIACGDASASVKALVGTGVSHYRGIDLSEPGLALAGKALKTLGCPFQLEHSDFTKALASPGIAADVAWIGLSLHHLKTPQKRKLMQAVRLIVGDAGKFLIYENASPTRETRDKWLRRWDQQRPEWRAFSDDQWQSITMHVHRNDHPESHVGWLTLGYEAGFGRARCLYASPNELFRLYCFEA